MRGKRIEKSEIAKIVEMRQTGHSLPEICRFLKRGGATVYCYAKDVKVLPEYVDALRQKRGGSKARAKIQWDKSVVEASSLLEKIEKREKLFILASLYWGEGTKKEFNLINSDPALVQVFISCLKEIGITKEDLRISVRVYEGIDIEKAKKYWADLCKIKVSDILNVNVLKGKKIGKLPYGMCRVRVTKSAEYFKIIISMINNIKMQIIK